MLEKDKVLVIRKIGGANYLVMPPETGLKEDDAISMHQEKGNEITLRKLVVG